jgi:integral membrane protein
MTTQPTPSEAGPVPVRGNGLLTAYRIISIVTGVGLLALTLYAMPMKYLADDSRPVAVIGQVHGFLYMIYVVVTLLLANRSKWSLAKALLVLLAGTIPFAVFFAEWRVVKDERARADARSAAQPDASAPLG